MPADLPGSEEPRTDVPANDTTPIETAWPAGQAGPIGRAAPSWRPAPARQDSRSRRPFIFAGVAAVALLAGASAAFVALPGRSPSPVASVAAARPATSPAAPGSGQGHGGFSHGRGGFGGAGLGGAGLGMSLLGALHGQVVIAGPGGGYETADIQRGQVTAVSSASITLRSTDGFSKTYLVTSSTLVDAQRDGIASVRTGSQALLVATVNGGTATAVRIVDLTLLQQQRQSFGYPGQGGAGVPPGAQAG